jgi:hypothetical protein
LTVENLFHLTFDEAFVIFQVVGIVIFECFDDSKKGLDTLDVIVIIMCHNQEVELAFNSIESREDQEWLQDDSALMIQDGHVFEVINLVSTIDLFVRFRNVRDQEIQEDHNVEPNDEKPDKPHHNHHGLAIELVSVTLILIKVFVFWI